MIRCYSDSGTLVNSVGATSIATSLFLTDTTYLGMITNVYRNTQGTTDGELRGIWQSLEYVTINYPDEEDIEIVTDCESLVKKFNSLLKGAPINTVLEDSVPKGIKYYKTWKDIMKMCEGKKVTVYHVKGHQESHNPNKVCDLISTFMLNKMKI